MRGVQSQGPTPPAHGNIDNGNFLRPLFVSLFASPILLLDNRSWSGGKRKIGISKFVDVRASFIFVFLSHWLSLSVSCFLY